MLDVSPRNLRIAERFLLAPPLSAHFGKSTVEVCDISAKGARFRHIRPLETGAKSILALPVQGKPRPLSVEAVVVWTHTDTGAEGNFVSGVRTYGSDEQMNSLLAQLHAAKRSNRIEELRSTDRFYVVSPLDAFFADAAVRIADLSARGARIETGGEVPRGSEGRLRFMIPETTQEVSVLATVAWSAVKSVSAEGSRYHSGLVIREKPELLRLAIGQLCETKLAVLDTHSLGLKLKIMRARAREAATSAAPALASGIPAEPYLLIQCVREELRLNPEEALHWYRRARITIADPNTRKIAPHIADHPDAIAVWEYLDRSIDPSVVGRAFDIL